MAVRDEASGGGRAGAVRVALLVASLCAVYMVSQFLRNTLGVLAPELARDLALSPEKIGLLSSLFFLSFALVQIPLGVALDRFGPRACMLVCVVFAAAGAALFSLAGSFAVLVLARMLMGVGCSSFFMAPLALYARWFPPERFSTLAGIQLGFGTLGTILATAPLGYAAATFGWRGAFAAVAVLAMMAGVLIVAFVRDDPPGEAPRAKRPLALRDALAGLGAVVRVPSLWPLFAIHFASYSCFIVLLGLWGGPYLADVHGLGLERRGEFLLVLAFAHVVGSFAYGPSDRLTGSRKAPVVAGGAASAACLALIALVPLPLGALMPVFAATGFVSGYISVQTAHGRALFPDSMVGRGITFLNMGVMLGVFCMQTATGLIVGLFAPEEGGARPAAAYQASFGFAAAILALAVFYYALGAEDRGAGGALRPRRRPGAGDSVKKT